MRIALAAAVISAYWSYACCAAPADDPAGREAESYMVPCESVPAALHLACGNVQAAFVAQYRRAMSGSTSAQQDVAVWLMDGGVGLRKNATQGCAWALVSTEADLAHADAARVRGARAWCAPAGADGLALAEARARQIVDAMDKAGIRQRPGDADGD